MVKQAPKFNWTKGGEAAIASFVNVINQEGENVYFWLPDITTKARGKYTNRTDLLINRMNAQKDILQGQEAGAKFTIRTLQTGYDFMVELHRTNEIKDRTLHASIGSIIAETARLTDTMNDKAAKNEETEKLTQAEYDASSAEVIRRSLESGKCKPTSKKAKRVSDDDFGMEEDLDGDEIPRTPKAPNKRTNASANQSGHQMFEMAQSLTTAASTIATALGGGNFNPPVAVSSSAPPVSAIRSSPLSLNRRPEYQRNESLVDMQNKSLFKLMNHFEVHSILQFLTEANLPADSLHQGGWSEEDVLEVDSDNFESFVKYLCGLYIQGQEAMRTALMSDNKMNVRNCMKLITFFEKSLA